MLGLRVLGHLMENLQHPRSSPFLFCTGEQRGWVLSYSWTRARTRWSQQEQLLKGNSLEAVHSQWRMPQWSFSRKLPAFACRSRGNHCYCPVQGSEALGSLTWLYPFQQHILTQGFLCSLVPITFERRQPFLGYCPKETLLGRLFVSRAGWQITLPASVSPGQVPAVIQNDPV